MILLVQIIVIFLTIIQYIIIADVILSWLLLFGVNLNIRIIKDITEPIFNTIRRFIPTSIGMIDIAPLIALIIIIFTLGVIQGKTGVTINNIF